MANLTLALIEAVWNLTYETRDRVLRERLPTRDAKFRNYYLRLFTVAKLPYFLNPIRLLRFRLYGTSLTTQYESYRFTALHVACVLTG